MESMEGEKINGKMGWPRWPGLRSGQPNLHLAVPEITMFAFVPTVSYKTSLFHDELLTKRSDCGG